MEVHRGSDRAGRGRGEARGVSDVVSTESSIGRLDVRYPVLVAGRLARCNIARIQTIEKYLSSFPRVEWVVGQREGVAVPGIGVDERELNECRSDGPQAARIIGDEPDAGLAVETMRKVPQASFLSADCCPIRLPRKTQPQACKKVGAAGAPVTVSGRPRGSRRLRAPQAPQRRSARAASDRPSTGPA